MGYWDSFTYVLSYAGMLVLGVGILLSLLGIATALLAILSLVPRMRGVSLTGRVVTLVLVLLATNGYLGALPHGSVPGWWPLAVLAGLVLGAGLPLLRLDMPLADHPYHLGIALSGIGWWVSWITSQGVLVAGNQGQGLVAPVLAAATGWFVGFSAGSIVRQLRQRASTPPGAEAAR